MHQYWIIWSWLKWNNISSSIEQVNMITVFKSFIEEWLIIHLIMKKIKLIEFKIIIRWLYCSFELSLERLWADLRNFLGVDKTIINKMIKIIRKALTTKKIFEGHQWYSLLTLIKDINFSSLNMQYIVEVKA